MTEPILKAEEVQALLDAIAPEEAATAYAASLPPLPHPKEVEKLELGEQRTVNPDQYPMFGHIHQRLTELIIERWSAIFRRDIPVFFKEICVKSYIELLDSVEPRVYFTMESPGLGNMLLVLDASLVASYIDAILGGAGEIALQEGGSLTTLELHLAERIAESTSHILSNLWRPVQNMSFRLRRIDTDPMNLAMTAEDVPCFSVTNVIVLGEEVRGDFSVHYPITFLEPLLIAMRSQERMQSTSESDHGWQAELRDAINHVPIELRLELARCTLKVRDFLALKPGDFLPVAIPEDEPATLWIDAHPIFLGTPGQHKGMLAVEILKTIQIGGTDE